MNIRVIIAIMTCFLCNLWAEDLERDVRNAISKVVTAKNSDEVDLQVVILRDLSLKVNNPTISHHIAELANLILKKDGFSKKYNEKLNINKRINFFITFSLASAWYLSLMYDFPHTLEKNSPLLALTGAYVIGTFGNMLPDNFATNSATKFLSITFITSLWWVVLYNYIKPQELSNPWDLMTVLFPVTAGFTKRFVIDPSTDYISRRWLGVQNYEPFKGV